MPIIAHGIDNVTACGYNRCAKEMYNVKQAATEIGLSERHLRLLLKRGEIEGKKLGRDWIVLSLDYRRKRKPKRR